MMQVYIPVVGVLQYIRHNYTIVTIVDLLTKSKKPRYSYTPIGSIHPVGER